ncbi:hypothetical protein [Falsiroseomonas sp.]|uniref:hypothetical protein n=1 Tax=Falsiroseomonas sp. TaxID=2870721 RepID=UPI003F6F120E
MEGGGSYIIQADGTRVRAEEPTRSHPAGDAPRNADGQVIGYDGLPVAQSAEQTAAPRRRRPRAVPAPAAPTDPAPEPASQPEEA